MTSVLTLISPSTGHLTDAIVATTTRGLERAGATLDRREWLSEGEACDLFFSDADEKTCNRIIRHDLLGELIDIVAQPVNGRRKKLLLADMDSTLVTSETLDELAEHAGLKDRISEITARAMNGEIAFEGALHERVSLLRGLPEDALAKTMERIDYSPGAETLVRTMAAHGAYTALVSGGFSYFTGKVKAALGFDFEIGNQLEIKNGVLSGQVTGPIVTRDTKYETLLSLTRTRGLALSESMAVGDGANDLPMLQAAGTGVAYHAKPVVIKHAPYRLDFAGLDALLFIQGYRRQEFVC